MKTLTDRLAAALRDGVLAISPDEHPETFAAMQSALAEYDESNATNVESFDVHKNAQRVRDLRSQVSTLADKIDDTVTALSDIAGQMRGIGGDA